MSNTDGLIIKPTTINQLKKLHQSIHKTIKTIEIIQNIQQNQQNSKDVNNNIIRKLRHSDIEKDQEKIKQNGKKDNIEKQKLYNNTKEKIIQLDENEEIKKENNLHELQNFEEIDEIIENDANHEGYIHMVMIKDIFIWLWWRRHEDSANDKEYNILPITNDIR